MGEKSRVDPNYFRFWIGKAADGERLSLDHDFNDDNLSYFYRHPQNLLDGQRSAGTLRGKSVLVAGGGIAGLTAAYECVGLGAHVTLIEASDRFGGRIETHRFTDESGRSIEGAYGELGAMRVPPSHRSFRHYVDRLGLSDRLIGFTADSETAWLYLGKDRVRQGDAEGLWDLVHGGDLYGAARLQEGEESGIGYFQNRPPQQLIEDMIDLEWARLPDRDKWRLACGHTPELEDKRTVDLLYGNFRQALIQFFGEIFHQEGPEERRRLGAWNELTQYYGWATGLVHFFNASAVSVLFLHKMLDSPEKQTLCGGMDGLPRAFATWLEAQDACDVHRNTRLRGVRQALGKDGERGPLAVRVTVKKPGSEEPEDTEWRGYDYVVVALPAKQVLSVDFSPELEERKRIAYQEVHYSSATKGLALCRAPFWRDDGVREGCTRTDRLPQQIYYPAHDKAPDRAGKANDLVLTCAYMWENDSRSFAVRDEADKRRILRDHLSDVHPRSGPFVRDLKWKTWDERSGTGGGYAFYAPGQQTLYQASMMAPHPEASPRTFFAGEHLALPHGWIQTAMQSAVGAVLAICEAERGRLGVDDTPRIAAKDLEIAPAADRKLTDAEEAFAKDLESYLALLIRNAHLRPDRLLTAADVQGQIPDPAATDRAVARCFGSLQARGLLTPRVRGELAPDEPTRYVSVLSTYQYIDAVLNQRRDMEHDNFCEVCKPGKDVAKIGAAFGYLGWIKDEAASESRSPEERRLLAFMYMEDEYLFHEAIAKAAGRSRTKAVIRKVQDALYVTWRNLILRSEIDGDPAMTDDLRGRLDDPKETVGRYHGEHAAIWDAIQGGDVGGGESPMQRHLLPISHMARPQEADPAYNDLVEGWKEKFRSPERQRGFVFPEVAADEGGALLDPEGFDEWRSLRREVLAKRRELLGDEG